MKKIVIVWVIVWSLVLWGCSNKEIEVSKIKPIIKEQVETQVSSWESQENSSTWNTENLVKNNTESKNNSWSISSNEKLTNNNIVTNIELEMKKLWEKVNTLWYDYCYTWSYDSSRKILDEQFNNIELIGLITDSKNGISIDFGKHWFEYSSWTYYFWPKDISGWPCVPDIFRTYSLSFENLTDYNEFLKKIKSQEYDDWGDNRKITNTFEMNWYKIIVVEEKWWYPTFNVTYNLVWDKSIILIKTLWIDPNENYKIDIESVIKSIKSI
jgi:hypothetical protein